MARPLPSQRLWALAASAFVAACGLGPAAAQEAPAPPAVATPAPIPLAEVPVRVEEVQQRLRELEQRALPEPEETTISERVAERLEAFESNVEDALGRVASLPELAELDDLEQRWQRERQTLQEWDRKLGTRAQQRGDDVRRLAELQQRWELTLAELRTADAPARLAARVETALAEIEATRQRLEERRDTLLTTQNQVAQQAVRADEVLTSIDGARRQVLGRLFVPDRLPLWNALRERPSDLPVLQRVRTALGADLRALLGYLGEHRSAAPTVLVLWIGLLLAALSLRRRARRWGAEDENVRRTTLAFERPVSASFLIWLPLTLFLVGGPPTAVRKLVGLLMVPALLRLLLPLLERPLLPLFATLMSFVVVDRTREVLDGLPVVERSLFVLELLAAGAVLLWLRRPGRLRRIVAGERGLRWLDIVTRGALLLISAALVANLLGYGRLSRLLGNGVLNSAYAAVVAYAAVRILDGVIVLLLRTALLRRLRMVQVHRPRISLAGRRGVRWALLGLWAFAVLHFFSLREPVQNGVLGVLRARLSVGSIGISLGDVVAFGFTLWLSYSLARLLRVLLDEEVFPRVSMRRGVPYAISSFASYVVLFVGFVFAVAAAGIDFGRITLLAGALGVGIGFGLQNVVNDFVSGAILLFERPIQLGDTVQMGELFGEIKRIGLRSSTVHSWEGAEVIVPNAQLTSAQIVNWTLSDRKRRIELPVGVAYGTDPERVLEILCAVARDHPQVLDTPAPSALFLGFGESSLDFQLRAWTDQFEKFFFIRSDLAVGINRALREAGITIPFPQRDLHLRSADVALSVQRDGGAGGTRD